MSKVIREWANGSWQARLGPPAAGSLAITAAGAGVQLTGVAMMADAVSKIKPSKGSNRTSETKKDGTPGNNQAQNKEFNDVVKKLRLTKDEAQRCTAR